MPNDGHPDVTQPWGKVSLTISRKITDGNFGNREATITDSRTYNSIQERDAHLIEMERNSKTKLGLILGGGKK